MAYYYDHQPEIDKEIREELDEVEQAKERSSPSPFLVRMKAKGIL